jgi:hypothetical protein
MPMFMLVGGYFASGVAQLFYPLNNNIVFFMNKRAFAKNTTMLRGSLYFIRSQPKASEQHPEPV